MCTTVYTTYSWLLSTPKGCLLHPQFEAVPCLGDNRSTQYTPRDSKDEYISLKKYSAREVQTFLPDILSISAVLFHINIIEYFIN